MSCYQSVLPTQKADRIEGRKTDKSYIAMTY